MFKFNYFTPILLGLVLIIGSISAEGNSNGKPKIKKIGEYRVYLRNVFLNQPTSVTPFGRLGFFYSGGKGDAKLKIDGVKYRGTADFISSLFAENTPVDSPSGLEESTNILASIVMLELSPVDSDETVTFVFQQLDAFYGDQACGLGLATMPGGPEQNATCGEVAIIRPFVGGYGVDPEGNPTNQLAITLGETLYRFMFYARINSQFIDADQRLVLDYELYMIDPNQD